MEKSSGSSPPGRKYRVIELRLTRPNDMFEMPQTDVFSEYRNFLTGVDFCLSALRGSLSRRPVRLQIRLPAEEINAGLDDRMARTLRRYCKHRLRYNRWESRALRLGGISALRIGVPVTALGLILTVLATGMRPARRCCQCHHRSRRLGTGLDRAMVPAGRVPVLPAELWPREQGAAPAF